MPKFLDTESVFKLHAVSLRRFGGSEGVRDLNLIESALGAAMNTYHYGNGDVFDIAASYAFHLAQAQAFLDGNKRTAVVTALVFLEINGIMKTPDDARLYDAMIAIAERRLDKAGLAEIFRQAAV
ncbi:MAG: type II toxin-antitoxin system death-on-curing family toxin [Methylacidiphilales bacterium]|nr:type II toxin-antitoxin system death-on-curing family toxin [Candidatus Methylacidiphilales bacterium]